TGGYNCLKPGSQTAGKSLAPQANEPNSPLVQGVTTLTTMNLGTGGLAAGAISVWDYATVNQPAIARCAPGGHNRADTNFYPNAQNLNVGGDYITVIKNALLFVS